MIKRFSALIVFVGVCVLLCLSAYAVDAIQWTLSAQTTDNNSDEVFNKDDTVTVTASISSTGFMNYGGKLIYDPAFFSYDEESGFNEGSVLDGAFVEASLQEPGIIHIVFASSGNMTTNGEFEEAFTVVLTCIKDEASVETILLSSEYKNTYAEDETKLSSSVGLVGLPVNGSTDCIHENFSTVNTATCTKAGSTTVTCNDCNSILYVEASPKTGHSYVSYEENPEAYQVDIPATSTTKGTAFVICSNPGCESTKSVQLPMLSHFGNQGGSCMAVQKGASSDDNTATIRIIAGINATEYQEAGIILTRDPSIDNYADAYRDSRSCIIQVGSVYSGIRADGELMDASQFGGSQYLIAATITGIPAAQYGTDLYAFAYVKHNDTYIYCTENVVNFTINSLPAAN